MKRIKTKIDPYTCETFYPKRKNQKFATRQNRIDFNNEKAAEIRKIKAPVNTPLHRNFLILQNVMRGKKEEIFHKQFLLGKGFSFHHVTHTELYNGKYVFACYSYIWFQLTDDNNQTTDQIKIIAK